MTDPISDMLTQIRNALKMHKPEVVLPYSDLKHNLAKILASDGWIKSGEAFEVGSRKSLKIGLSYADSGAPVISGLRRISRPGQRIYAKVSDIPRLRLGVGTIIISTSKGLMTDKEARKLKMGGEVICQIW